MNVLKIGLFQVRVSLNNVLNIGLCRVRVRCGYNLGSIDCQSYWRRLSLGILVDDKILVPTNPAQLINYKKTEAKEK